VKIDLLDVFANGALSGNPLAVVHGGEHLSAEQMLRLTQWIGFSETTFLLPPTAAGADYRVRIFYPSGEMLFAGHPTLGSAYAWLAAGGVAAKAGEVVQECGVGLVKVRQDGDRLAFAAPPMRRTTPLSEAERAAAVALAGVTPEQVVAAAWADNGPPWQLLHLASAEAVLAAKPAPLAPAGTDIGLVGPSDRPGVAWEVRGFFTQPSGSFCEDPVTGSLNAGIAHYLYDAGLAQGDYAAAQGRCVGADGRICVHRDDDIWIGGMVRCVALGGELTL